MDGSDKDRKMNNLYEIELKTYIHLHSLFLQQIKLIYYQD